MESKNEDNINTGVGSPSALPSKSNDKKDPPSSDLFTNDGPHLSAPGAVRCLATNRLGEKKLDREIRSSQTNEQTNGTTIVQERIAGKNVGLRQSRNDQPGATFELNQPSTSNAEDNPPLVSNQGQMAEDTTHPSAVRSNVEKKKAGWIDPEDMENESSAEPNSNATKQRVVDNAPLDADVRLLSDEVPSEENSLVRKHKNGGMILLLVIIVAVVVAGVLAAGKGGDENKQTSTDVEVDPTLIPNVLDSTLVKLSDKNSPQYKAYDWMVQDPMFDQYEDWRITQRFSLATFYYAMNGPRWENSWSWLDYEVNECDWLGHKGTLSCNDDLKINLLNITKQRGFKGKMPIEVTLLTNLEGIDFSHNLLGGDIAELFDNDFNHNALKVFWCSECRLGGTIPVEFAQMTALEGVILSNNDITGELPSEMGQVQRLKILEMDGNKFTGAIPSTIGNLQALSVLRLRENLLSSLPSEVGKLTDMKVLYLGENRLRQSIPSELGALDNMKLLDLDRSGFEGAIPSELGLLTNLQRLLLNKNKFSDSIPQEIGSLSKMEWLWMNENKLVGSIPASIGNMTLLKKMNLGDNDLTSSIPSEIGLLLRLKDLGLYSNELSGSIPSEIANLAWLNTFDVTDNPFIVQELPEEFCASPPQHLMIDWCSDVSCCA